MTIRARFVCEANPASQTIAYFSQDHLSHAGALTDDGYEWGARSDHVGGKPPGVQKRPGRYAKFSRQVIFEIPTATVLQEQGFWAWWEAIEGMPYDSKAIWGFAFDRSWHHPGWWICSAALVACFQSIDLLAYDLYLPPPKCTPVMAAQLTSGIKGAVRVA